MKPTISTPTKTHLGRVHLANPGLTQSPCSALCLVWLVRYAPRKVLPHCHHNFTTSTPPLDAAQAICSVQTSPGTRAVPQLEAQGLARIPEPTIWITLRYHNHPDLLSTQGRGSTDTVCKTTFNHATFLAPERGLTATTPATTSLSTRSTACALAGNRQRRHRILFTWKE
ncbi:hypothetical protein HYQ46_001971 [Verticillium longisporum]|nr:hypothetical protein HYQ46_001971 [Verticillium longisporum]